MYKKYILMFFWLTPMLLLGQNKIELATGLGVLDFSPQNISYTNYLPGREPYQVIPPRQHLIFFPASIALRKSLVGLNEKLTLGLGTALNLAALLTTSGGGNYFALQIPTRLDLKYKSSNNLGFLIGGGMAFSRMVGDALIKRSDFLPVVELGFQFYIGNRKIEMCYNRTIVTGQLDFDEPPPWSNWFSIEGIDVQTQSFIVRYYLRKRKSVEGEL